jgi:HTH-type transcriptional regulator / antitoxin HigA
MEELIHANPDTVLHPGEHLKDYLDSQGMSQSEFCRRAGVSEKHVSQIISGKAGITADMALSIERVLGGRAEMWVNLDAAYRLRQAREEQALVVAESVEWAKKLPVSDLRARGIVHAKRMGPEVVDELFRFFAVAGREEWDGMYGVATARYRQSTAYAASLYSQAAYLRMCELKADLEDLPAFDRAGLEAALKAVRGRLGEDPEKLLSEARDLLRPCGVALVMERALSGSRLSGAAFWPRRNRAIIALTDRFKTADHLWFSFFHESGHLLLHKDRDVLEVDDVGGDLENEADSFAREMLIPASAYEELTSGKALTMPIIRSVAEEHCLPVDSLVGMLQHHKVLPHQTFREVKRCRRTSSWSDLRTRS